MKHITILLAFAFVFVHANNVYAGDHSNTQITTVDSLQLLEVQKEIKSLKTSVKLLESENKELKKEIQREYERLNNVQTEQQKSLQTLSDSIGVSIENTNAAVNENSYSVKKRSLWGVIIAALLVILSAVTFFILRKRISQKGDDIALLRARADELNRQMVERMDKELTELQNIALKLNSPQVSTPNDTSSAEPDHTLVKALADRITFMEMTLYRMDSSVRGHHHLTRSIRQMKDNLLANGYEIVDMLGKDYVDGMRATPSFNDDESIEQGKRIITGITKPQINYKGQMIQAAQITVSQNI